MTQAPQIMLVDDDNHVRELLRELLEEVGYAVATFPDGQKAFDYLVGAATRPRVILLDLMMPVMDGASFLRAQSAEAALADIPVVLITAAGKDAADAVSSGEVLHKPFKIEAVLGAIEKYCGPPPA